MTTKRELLKKIRLFCNECMGGPRAIKEVWPIEKIIDVQKCTDYECIFYKYRFGHDPHPNPTLSENARIRAMNMPKPYWKKSSEVAS